MSAFYWFLIYEIITRIHLTTKHQKKIFRKYCPSFLLVSSSFVEMQNSLLIYKRSILIEFYSWWQLFCKLATLFYGYLMFLFIFMPFYEKEFHTKREYNTTWCYRFTPTQGQTDILYFKLKLMALLYYIYTYSDIVNQIVLGVW